MWREGEPMDLGLHVLREYALLADGERGALIGPRGDVAWLCVPRWDSDAVLSSLIGGRGREGYVYRFRHARRPRGDAEGAFLLCGFWMALASQQQGDTVGAARWFERNRAACGPPGLFSEEYDVQQRQLRGNLPQAFVHATMLEASVRLTGPWPGDER